MKVGLALGAAVFAAAACSGSSLQPDAAGQLQLDGAAGDRAIPPGGFVTADVDGVTVRAEMQAAAYWFNGIQEGYLGIGAQSAEWQWVFVLQNTVGPGTCPGVGYIVLQPVGAPTMGRATYAAGGACATNVTAAAPAVGDMLEGTFTATLRGLGGGLQPATVTNGAFRVPRIADGL